MIFNLFKSKPVLKELIPDGFVDIHSHILPGIDDGAKTIQESISLISEMKKLGFAKVIGTPHTFMGVHDNSNESIKNSYNLLKSKLTFDIELNYASEYMLDFNIIRKAREKTLLCLKDNYVLVEMSYISKPNNLKEIIFEIIHNGYKPILAHPERYLFLKNSIKEYEKLKLIGLSFQINLLSATGYYGPDVCNNLNTLLKNDLVDFVGSDTHNAVHLEKMKLKLKISEIKRLADCIKKNEVFL